MRKTLENVVNNGPAATAETHKAQQRGKPESDLYKSTFFIPRAVYKVLREHAMTNETSIQQIQLEALDKWLVQETGKTMAEIVGKPIA